MLEEILEYADEHDMLPESGLVLACVSGGADSMCLLEALLHISYERGFTVGVVHYNHGLRGEESERDEIFVKDICDACGVEFFSGAGDVRAYAKKHKLSLEAAARDMRYRFFFDTAEIIKAVKIATAHTADDNAETLLINLARGAGANGLSGIPPKRDIIIRPMLRISRGDVMNFVRERSIPYVEDSTNNLDIFTRNKIRHAVVPILREINPRFCEAVTAAAELLRADEELLSDLADFFIADCCAGLTTDAADLLNLPIAVSGRVIRKLHGGDISYRHVKAVLELCGHESPSASVSLPAMTVYREYGRLVFAPKQELSADSFAPVYLEDGDSAIVLAIGLKISCKSVIYDDKISKVNKSFTSFLFKSIDICGKMTVRSRREGDTIRIFGHNNTKTLKKLFIERRIPARKRGLTPVIADDEGVLAIYGLAIGDRAIPESGDAAIQIDFEEI